MSAGLCLLVGTGFQVLFHSPSGVLFTFPSRYCFTIGHRVVFSLRGWAPCIPTGLHVSDGTRLRTIFFGFRVPDCHRLWCFFPETSAIFGISCVLLWAGPRSLAATGGIEVSFFSSRYLDVSVPALLPRTAMVFTVRYLRIAQVGCPIRRSPDRSLCATPRSISVLVPSFFASRCQGIRPVPFLA